MGQTRTKAIETAIEPEKATKIEKESKKAVVETKEKETIKERPPRKRSRRYKDLLNFIEKTREYTLEEAIKIIKEISKTKFDESVEAHINLNFQKDKSDQQIRTSVTLPHQPTSKKEAGKKMKLLVFASKNTEEIKKLGADIGTEATLKQIEAGKIEHSKIIADLSWMPKLAKTAKVLGPKGLMPNPKSGTVTDDPASVVKEFAKGKLDLRSEKLSIIHTQIGKTSFSEAQLLENLKALIEAVKAAKPESLKRGLFKSIYLSTTMGPSIKLDLSQL